MINNQGIEILLQELRKKLADFLPNLEGYRQSDWFLLKFLQEHHFNVCVAAENLRMGTVWKGTLKIGTLRDEKRTEMFRRFPYHNYGFDRDGHPILLVPFGRWKIREAIENGEREHFLRHAIQMTEINQDRLAQTIESSNGVINTVIIIFDLKEYSIRQLMSRQSISVISEWTKRSEQLYPQQLRTFYVINGNRLMPILFSLLKPFMSKNTVNHVRIFGSDTWQDVLFDHIPLDQLSIDYGGTNPNCFDFLPTQQDN